MTPTAAATAGSGIGPQVTVRWEVARDSGFTDIVSAGLLRTGPKRDHTVKVDATGLAPQTSYFYRFRFRDHVSAIGRTKTAPAADETPERVRFGVASCANLQAGYFAAYRHLARRQDLDAVLHLGDYLYEYGPGEYGYGRRDVDIRRHVPAREVRTLADYRQRHAQYKRDPDLQELHAALPFIVSWDDHDSANDAYRRGAANHTPGTEGRWAARRRNAVRAYDEWMPVRLGGTTRVRDGLRLYRRLRFGTLVDLAMLDLRSYRSRQVRQTRLAAVDAPTRTITGSRQMEWLKDLLGTSSAHWKLVGNPVMIAPVVFPDLPPRLAAQVRDTIGLLPEEGVPINVDQWDGYTADRRELFGHLARQRVENTVFVTGDIHSAWACDLPLVGRRYPGGRTVGTEFICTSVTSNNLDDITGSRPRTSSLRVESAVRRSNRHVKYVNLDYHGFSILDVTESRLQMDYYRVTGRRRRSAGARWQASWATDSGTQRVHRAAAPVSG